MRTAEIIERFSLEGVSRTNAVFDRPKLEWFNTQYLQKLPIEELLPAVQDELEALEAVAAGIGRARSASGFPRRWTCCARARACCRIFRHGRARFSAIRSSTNRGSREILEG